MEQGLRILRDDGCGAADGCSVNMTWLKQEGSRVFHNAEMGPAQCNTNESVLNVLTTGPGEHLIHCNIYQRLPIDQVPDSERIVQNSWARLETLSKYPAPRSKNDVINMLGDQSGNKYTVFQDYEDKHNEILTIAVGTCNFTPYGFVTSFTNKLCVLQVYLIALNEPGVYMQIIREPQNRWLYCL